MNLLKIPNDAMNSFCRQNNTCFTQVRYEDGILRSWKGCMDAEVRLSRQKSLRHCGVVSFALIFSNTLDASVKDCIGQILRLGSIERELIAFNT